VFLRVGSVVCVYLFGDDAVYYWDIECVDEKLD
jgi:hypothetical protein